MVESTYGDGLVHVGESAFKGHFIIKKTIGKQIVGYTVDLAKQSPEAVKEWLKDTNQPKTEDGSIIPTPDANSKYVAPAKKEDEAEKKDDDAAASN